MRDVREQLVVYAEILDRAAPRLEELAPTDATASPLRPVVAAAAAAAATAVLVGGIAFLARSTTTLPPTATAAAPTLAPIVANLVNPVAVSPETFPDVANPFAGPGGVAAFDGRFHMLSAAYGEGSTAVVYAVSDDGVVWSQGSLVPVLQLEEAPWAPRELDYALPRSLVVDASGLWQLFFEISWFDAGLNSLRANIGRATAPSPTGPWAYDTRPVLQPDSAITWMDKRVASPSVVKTTAGMVMFFIGYGADNSGVVGRADSMDGRVWSLVPDPMLTAEGDWERGSISKVDVVAGNGGYAMFYAGDTPSLRGLAASADGLAWVAHPANPILPTADLPQASVFDSEFLIDGNSIIGLIERGRARSEREVAVVRLSINVDLVVFQLTGGE